MRKSLYGMVFEDFIKALQKLGYKPVYPKNPCFNWKRGSFHIHLNSRKGLGRIIVSLHKDVPTSLPPFHRAVKGGKDILKEFHRITETYGEVRRKKAAKK